MTVQNYIQEGDKMLQIGVPIMCMRAVDKYIDANLLVEEGDPMKILLYSRIAVANFKIPKLERALSIAEMGLQLCNEYQESSLISMDVSFLDRLGRNHLLQVKDQVRGLYDSLGTEYDDHPVDINERYFGKPELKEEESYNYADDLHSDFPISHDKAVEIFQITNLPDDIVKVINKASKEVFGVQNGYLSSYSGDQDVENRKLYNRIINNEPADNISSSEYGKLERYKVQDFIDAFKYYVRNDQQFANLINNFQKNVVDSDGEYYEVYCQAFIEEFMDYFNDRLDDSGIQKLSEYIDKAIVGSIKKIVGKLL